MIYFSHRGSNTKRVQNTVEAFALAQAQGATYYELDVHLLRDGQLAVHHDYSLLSTAGVDVRLKDLTSTELSNYPLINPFTSHPVFVPLLQDVLPVIIPDLCLLNIELKNDDNKYPGLETAVLLFLKQYAQLTGKVLFSSFDYNTLIRLRALAPQARIGLLTRKFDVQQALDLQAESVHINHIRLTPKIIQACRAHHLSLYCYTVNDKELAQRLSAQGVAGIFTDDVTLFNR